VLFLFKKLVGPLFFPHTVCLALLVVSVFLLWFSSRQRLAKVLATISAFGLIVLSYPLIWRTVVLHVERENAPLNTTQLDLADVRWVVVLGGGGDADPTIPPTAQLSRASLARLVEGLRVHNALSSTKLVLTGGGIFGEKPLAILLEQAAETLGANPQQIVITATPRDTEEESVEVKRIVRNDPFVLVTSAMHMPRALLLFRKQGLSPIPDPTDFWERTTWTPTPQVIFPDANGAPEAESMLREVLGIIWAKLRGRA